MRMMDDADVEEVEARRSLVAAVADDDDKRSRSLEVSLLLPPTSWRGMMGHVNLVQ